MWNKCAEMIVIHYLFIFTFFPGCKAVDMQLIPADNLLDHVHFKQIHQWGTFWSLQVHQQSHSGYFGFHKTFTTDLSVDSFAVVSVQILLLTFCEIGLSLDLFYTRSIKGSGSRESPVKNEVKHTKTVSHGHVTCKHQCWQSLVIPYWSSLLTWNVW